MSWLEVVDPYLRGCITVATVLAGLATLIVWMVR